MENCFRASAGCSKFWMIKNIFNTVNSGHTVFQGKHKLLIHPECNKYFKYSQKFHDKLFSGQAQSFSKILKYKKYFNAVKNFRANYVFQRKRMLFKLLNGQIYIYSIQWIQGTFCFSGQAQVAQKSSKIKNISTQWKVSGRLCFSGPESCSKIWIIKKQWRAVRGGKEGSSSPTIIMKCAKRIRDQK